MSVATQNMPIPAPFDSKDKLFDMGEKFWNNYLNGRPSPPEAFFERIFSYHQKHSGRFGTVHDVGAGNGPYAQKLRSRFHKVIVSDIAAHNIELAQNRLGTDGFTYRAARVEEADDIPAGSVDMVFATNVMHFCDQKVAMATIARQLAPGGTFICAGFGPAHFDNPEIQDVYARITHSGGRAILRQADDQEKLIAIMARTEGYYNVAPFDEEFFKPGVQRIHLNMKAGGLVAPLPEDIPNTEPSHTGPHDIEVFDDEAGWDFVTDLKGVREHVKSFPFSKADPQSYAALWQEMEQVISKSQTPVKGHWPAKVILGTRR